MGNDAMRGSIRFWAFYLAALAMLALPSTSTAADDLSMNDLVGRWCGTVSDYTFTPTQLTVTLHSGEEGRVLAIEKVEANATEIEITWKPPVVGSTAFNKFSADKRQMSQMANDGGDNGPQREFHRC